MKEPNIIDSGKVEIKAEVASLISKPGKNKVGAPIGNKNSTKDKRVWGQIVRKLAIQEDYSKLHKVAEALYEKASDGDISAIKELGDRLDGKALQENVLTGDTDSPVTIQIVTGIDE
jgi:hypothetical protein